MYYRKMDMLQVSVTVNDVIWDQFIILNDNITFCEINDMQKTNPEQLQDVEPVLPDKLCENKDSMQSVRSNLQNNEENLLKKVDQLSISSHGDGRSYTAVVYSSCKCIPKLYINGYLLSLFVITLQRSAFYRKLVLARFQRLLHKSGSLKLNVKLMEPHKDIIDYSWGKRMERLALERRELDLAMSWLSTLGGAFSALGEQFQHCAEIAGRISVHQFGIALRLGDPLTVARCKLYLALSLVQQGHLVPARRIIEQQYSLAQEASVMDTRLVAMCLGIWARLKYEHNKRRVNRSQNTAIQFHCPSIHSHIPGRE